MDIQDAPAAQSNAPATAAAQAASADGTFLRTRDPHIDVMKGVGMLMVIMAHMQTLEYLGYSFLALIAMSCMPLFFFVNGYLHPTSSDRKLKFGPFVKKKAITLLIPYAIFFVVSFFWMQTVYAYSWDNPLFAYEFTWPELLKAFFFAGEFLYDLAFVPFPIWFLHALFFCSLVFFFLVKIKSKIVLAIIALALSIITLPLQTALADTVVAPIWLFDLMPVALFYMIFGYLFQGFVSEPEEFDTLDNSAKSKRVVFGAFAGLACILVGFFFMQEGRGNIWEITSYWHYPASMITILGVFLLSRSTNSKLLQYIGAASLFYLGLHPLILELSWTHDLPQWFADRGFDGITLYIGYFIVALIFTTLLVIVARGLQKLVKSIARTKGDTVSL